MPEDVPVRPQWLDDEFLKTCIRKSQVNLNPETKLLIKYVVLSYVVAKGENYMSVMYRAVVEYQVLDQRRQICKEAFVVKVAPATHDKGKNLWLLFDTEINMYINVVAKMEEILDDKGLNSRLICRYIHSIDEPKVIVLEDLKPQRFTVADRLTGMDLEHCKWVYSKLAKFHAAGMSYFQPLSEEEKLKYSLWGHVFDDKDSQGMVPMQQGTMQSIIKEMLTSKKNYTKAIDFLTKHIELLNKKYFPILPYTPDRKYHSLSHADFWVNNMMFQYKPDGSIEDMVFVDLQASHYDSIGNDFIFFFATSTTLEVRKNNYKELHDLYFNSLVSNLKQLEYKGHIPTMEEFDEELKLCVNYAIFGLTLFLPACLLKHDKEMQSRAKSEASSAADVMQVMQKLIGEKYFLDKALAIVDILQENGFMDKSPYF